MAKKEMPAIKPKPKKGMDKLHLKKKKKKKKKNKKKKNYFFSQDIKIIYINKHI